MDFDDNDVSPQFISCNKCTLLAWGLHSGEGHAYVGVGSIKGLSVLYAQFFCEPKIL